ncbi:MAG: adenylate/guanylate cyclase domain-containing response regulator [Bacteroidetes bacterium]|nr:MAG: adenylate/guanylate cyclase domain-containing response regulator [Bacteroidota bacterium]
MMIRILVVDDEADLEMLIRQKFRKDIREKKFDFLFASNGKEALEKLKEEPDIDLALSDINMPEMDGLTLLSKLGESYPLIKTIMVSAYGDMKNIRTAMNRGAFDFITKPIDFQDLSITMQKTLRHVKQIQETLKAIKENNILKMYVDEAVLNFMTNREYETKLLQNESVEASVIFVDICSFTAISERETPDVIVDMLNKYFDLMVKEIIDANGIIDKFMGDCVMAVFRGEYHLDRAIDAGIAIRDHIENLDPDHGFNQRVSIGIHSGQMIYGNIGSNTLKRLDFTVIGDVVNTAQRLQGKAEPNQILITESCYEKVKQSFNCKLVGPVSMKNKENDIVVYEVIS